MSDLKHFLYKAFLSLDFIATWCINSKNLLEQIFKIIVRYIKIGFNIDVLRQTACLVVNSIKVNNFAYLFNCTTAGRASD